MYPFAVNIITTAGWVKINNSCRHGTRGNKLEGTIRGKNLIVMAITLFMIFSAAFALSDKAAAATTAMVDSSDGLNVRSGPGTDYSILYVLENRAVVDVIEASGIWYKISYNGQQGYAHSDYLVLSESPEYVYDGDFEEELAAQGFPESYKEYLRQLHAAHPQWVFKAHQTGLDWNNVIEKESKVGVNLVHKSSPDSWKSRDYGAYDPSTGEYEIFDSGGWVAASSGIIQYYMDPRNFLKEGAIFQFMSHSYDSLTQTRAGLQELVAGTFLANKFPEAGYDTYSDALIYAGRQSDVNPYVLASMILVEQGRDGRGGSISGTVPGFEGYYNFFNVRAYASGSYDAVEYGLLYASESGSYGRPWNTRIKSIIGGALHYASNYINNNQNTLYLKKFNVMNGLGSVATHQYMTNVAGASQEASNLADGYGSSSAITFYIPVYKNMPAAACAVPGSGSNDYFLKSLSVDGYNLVPVFSMYSYDYELAVPAGTTAVKINAVCNDSGSKVSGSGNIALTGDITEAKVVVTATSGISKTYTITIAREKALSGNKPVSSVYNVGTYITGVGFATPVSTFKSNISAPEGCILKVTDSLGTEKTSGNVGTGYKVVIYDGSGKATSSTEVVVKGDNGGDGKCNSLDLLMIQRHIVGLSTLGGTSFTASDINGDGKVNSLDLLYVQRYIVGSYDIKN